MSHRVDSHSEEPFSDASVPVIFDFVVGPSGQVSSNDRPPVLKQITDITNQTFLSCMAYCSAALSTIDIAVKAGCHKPNKDCIYNCTQYFACVPYVG